MLKKNWLVAAVLVFSLASGAKELEHERTMAVSLSPLSLIIGNFDTLFQYNLQNFLTLTLPVGFTYFWPASMAMGLMASGSRGKLSQSSAPISIDAGVGARFYPTAKGMKDGFYVEPRFVTNYSQFGAEMADYGKVEWHQFNLGPILTCGFDWFYASGFYTSFGANIGYLYAVKNNVTVPDKLSKEFDRASYLSSFFPQSHSKGRLTWGLDFKLGFAF